jgi:heptaprenylglyceryl phosphate synthase
VSLTTAQRSRLRTITEDYAQALAAMRLAERELAQRRAAYVEYIGELADVVQSEEVKP